MARGDHLRAQRSGYHHDAIDLGDGRVVHYAAPSGATKPDACVQIASWDDFAGGAEVTVQPYGCEVDPEEVVSRAISRLGEAKYNLVFNNCEHFARWCVTGVHVSGQVVAASSAVASVGFPYLGASLGMDVVAAAGMVRGLSGSGMMSGLAAAGRVVGGGAVAGLAVLGMCPGMISLVAVSRYTFVDDADQPAEERRARTAARVGGTVGLVGGAVGGAWAVGHFGTAGLGAAGISSGLKAIGGLVGGNMAVGTMLVIALPAISVAVGALLAYGLWRWVEAWWKGRATGGGAALALEA